MFSFIIFAVCVFSEKLLDEQEFELIGDLSKVQPDEKNIPTSSASADEQASAEPEGCTKWFL